MFKTVVIAVCLLWLMLIGTRAQECDQTLDVTGNMDIAINGSITTCIRCVVGGTVQTTALWSAENILLMSGQNGVEISNGVLMITDGNVFLSNRPNPFQLSCSSSGGGVASDVYLAGFFAPTVSVAGGGSTVIDEGDTIALFCDDRTNIPGSTTRRWLDPQGVPTPFSFRNLILNNIQRNQAGEYQCQLTNVMDNATLSDSITVTVTYPTSVTSDSPASQFLGLGSLLSLTCTYDSVPPSTLTWYLDGVQLSAGVTTSGATSTLTVNSVLRTSGGVYMCTATNTLASGTDTTDSLSFNVTTIEVPPDPATNLAVSNIQETSVDLSWNNGFDGFSPITGVEIQVITGGSTQDTLTINGDDSLEFTTVPNLVPFTIYEFRLFVRNIRGLSTPVSVSNMTLSLTLLAPTILSLISPSSTSLRVTWAPPAPNATTDDPNSWIVQLLDSNEAMDNTIQDPATTEFLFVGLEKGTEYGVRVAGTNDRGMGAFSATVTRSTLVDPPTMPQDLVGTTVSAFGFELSWTGPAEDGGGVVSEYVVGYREMGGSEYNDVTLDSGVTELLLRNGGDPAPPVALVNSTTYEIRVQAVNEAGRGAEATTTLTTQSIDQPQRIFDPLVPSGVTNHAAMISWVFPGGMVTYFIVQYKFRADDWTVAGEVNVITVPGNMTSVLLPDLRPEAQYDIRVRTMNTLGVSEFSFEATFVTAPPSPPIVEGPTSAPAGQRAQINCSSSVTDLSFTWYRVTSESNASTLPPTARVVGTDLVFTEPTVMDTGIYVCRLGNSVTTQHTIIFIESLPPMTTQHTITFTGTLPPITGNTVSLSVGEAVGISVVVTFILTMVIGLLLGMVIMYCIMSARRASKYTLYENIESSHPSAQAGIQLQDSAIADDAYKEVPPELKQEIKLETNQAYVSASTRAEAQH